MTGAGHRSPNLDPVFLVCIILTIALLAAVGVHLASRAPGIACPPPDHPVWAQVLNHHEGEWICGASLTAGVKSR